jgi:hypothetical protein
VNEPVSRRAALEAAFDEHMVENDDGVVTEKEAPPEGAKPYEQEAVAAKKSQETPPGQEEAEGEGAAPGQQKPPQAAEGARKETPPAQGAPGAEGQGDGQGGAGTPIKAPISWRGPEKAHWDKIPRVAQEAIARRELETQQALSKSGQARQFVRDFGQTVMPYSHLIRAQGATPLAAVDNLMRTAAGLMTGNDMQKAAIVAEIISNYAVNVEALDNVLVEAKRRGPAPTHGQGVLPPQFAAALKPVYDFMGSVQQQREQYEQQQLEQGLTEVEQFGQNKPYFEEIRGEMGDLMEFAANRGQKITLDQAYQRVMALHPELQAPPGTQNQNQLSRAAATLARARRTGSSVKGGPASGGAPLTPPKNRREALERAWDEQSER